jgi:rare lipoprotein A
MTGTPRTHVLLVALACIAPAMGGLPALTSADDPSGGTAFPGGPGLHITSSGATMVGTDITFSGLMPTAAGKGIVVQRELRTDEWLQTATATADANGSFAAVWHANTAGMFPVRAIAADDPGSAPLAAVSTTSPVSALSAPLMTVYQPAIATWYGPGFFGHKMACGHTLTRHTLGVANRTLPCGTQVALAYGGRRIVVPVVDRGPYANHAHWDLTFRTARVLQMPGKNWIGAVSIPGSAPKQTQTTSQTTATSPSSSTAKPPASVN